MKPDSSTRNMATPYLGVFPDAAKLWTAVGANSFSDPSLSIPERYLQEFPLVRRLLQQNRNRRDVLNRSLDRERIARGMCGSVSKGACWRLMI